MIAPPINPITMETTIIANAVLALPKPLQPPLSPDKKSTAEGKLCIKIIAIKKQQIAPTKAPTTVFSIEINMLKILNLNISCIFLLLNDIMVYQY